MVKDQSANNMHFPVYKIQGKIHSHVTSVREIINVDINFFMM